jgi:hypothetical protein
MKAKLHWRVVTALRRCGSHRRYDNSPVTNLSQNGQARRAVVVSAVSN